MSNLNTYRVEMVRKRVDNPDTGTTENDFVGVFWIQGSSANDAAYHAYLVTVGGESCGVAYDYIKEETRDDDKLTLVAPIPAPPHAPWRELTMEYTITKCKGPEGVQYG